MEMGNLRLLHASMLTLGAEMQQFLYSVNHAEFDCLFAANQDPYLLCMTARGGSPLFLKFPVSPMSFEIPNVIQPDDFRALAKLLRTDGSSGNRLVPREFFSALNSKIPTFAKHKKVDPEELLRLRPDITEERDRPYFDTWIYWSAGNGPSAKNQEKTLAMMGGAALRHSIDFRCSSKWSSLPTDRSWQEVATRR